MRNLTNIVQNELRVSFNHENIGIFIENIIKIGNKNAKEKDFLKELVQIQFFLKCCSF
jgi:hypothetical protein